MRVAGFAVEDRGGVEVFDRNQVEALLAHQLGHLFHDQRIALEEIAFRKKTMLQEENNSF